MLEKLKAVSQRLQQLDRGDLAGTPTAAEKPSAPNAPVRPCYACGASAFWQREDGGSVCSVCHPDPRTPAPVSPEGQP